MWIANVFLFLLLNIHYFQVNGEKFPFNGEGSPPKHTTRGRNDLKIPKERMVKALREVFKVPESVILGRDKLHNSRRGPSPPKYMLDLFKRMTEGGESLPKKANTVRCLMPLEEQWDGPAYKDMILYNVTQAKNDHVLASTLHLAPPTRRRPRPHGIRVMLYLVKPHLSPHQTTPLVVTLLGKNDQTVDATHVVVDGLSTKNLITPAVGIRVEELRKGGRWVTIPSHKLVRRTPPILLVYSLDPSIMDLPPPKFHKNDNYLFKKYSKNDKTREWYTKSDTNEDEDNKHHWLHRRVTRDADYQDYDYLGLSKSQNLEDEFLNNEIGDTINSMNYHHNNNDDADKYPGVLQDLDDTQAYAILSNEIPHLDDVTNKKIVEKVDDIQFVDIQDLDDSQSDVVILEDNQRKRINKVFSKSSKNKDSDFLVPPKRRKKTRKRKKSKSRSGLIPYPDDPSLLWPEGAWAKWDGSKKDKKKRNKRKLKKKKKINELDSGNSLIPVLLKYVKNNETSSTDSDSSLGPCKRHHLRIKFSDIGWDDFIIAPAIVDPYFCAGSCDMSNINVWTNHAHVQNMIRTVGLNQFPNIPPPCCVPDKLSSMSLLTIDFDNNVILKKYKKMIVQSCKCQ